MIQAPSLSASPRLRHGFFTRRGGASSGVFSGLNCGSGSSDQSEIVRITRARAAEAMGLPADHLVGVHQVHSATVVTVTEPQDDKPRADALVTKTPGIALSISDDYGKTWDRTQDLMVYDSTVGTESGAASSRSQAEL